MPLFPRFKSFLRNLFRGHARRQANDRELDDEVRFHIETLAQEKIGQGMKPEQAWRDARLEFGGAEQVKERVRETRAGAWLDTFLQDVRFGLRTLRKNRGFTTVAVLTLALGIGANTAIFSLIDATLVRMLPVQHPEELVELQVRTERGLVGSFSYPEFERLRDGNHVFAGMLTVSSASLQMAFGGQTETTLGQYVSGNFFSLLGVRALVGRTIIPADDRIGGGGSSSVAVISYALWQRQFGRDSSAIGKQIEVEGSPFTIIGVAPPEFFGLQVGSSPGFWIPIGTEPLLRPSSWLRQNSYHWLGVVGRLKPGTSSTEARTNLEVIYNQTLSENASTIQDPHDRQMFVSRTIEMQPAANGLSQLRRRFSKPLLILMALVGLVLLLACANVASLLLARAASRQKELAVRMALGASRWRLIRQFLTESVLLALLGGAAGLLVAFWASDFLVALMSTATAPVVLNLRPDVRVLAFTALASLFTGILFGLAPAFRAGQVDAGPNLKEPTLARSGSRRSALLGTLLIILQIALSLVLLVGAGLFVGSLRKLKNLDPGFNSENVLLANVNPGKAGYKDAQLATFYQQLIERLKQRPGVVSVSLSMVTPISGGGVDLAASVEGYTPQPNEDNTVYVNRISPGYFATLGTPVLWGRDFGAQDIQTSPKVALINETMAKYYFQDSSPIGRTVTLGRQDPMEIIGVVKDAKYMNLRDQVPRTVYTNFLQAPVIASSLNLEVRTARSPLGFVPVLQSEVSAFSGRIQLTGFGTLVQQVDESLTQERLVATLSGFFGALALLLACVGLYGLMSYKVGNRTHEIGIRVALGANRMDVIWLVLREAFLLAMLGISLGVPAALATARLVASQVSGLLFGLSVTDMNTIALACIALMISAALASYIPAFRASRVDPMVALRHE